VIAQHVLERLAIARVAKALEETQVVVGLSLLARAQDREEGAHIRGGYT
jgi:hypothetical protein